MRMRRTHMRMRRQLVDCQRLALSAANLAESIIRQTGPLPRAIRDTAAQVRQGESGLAVAAVRGAKERKERRILRDGQYLSVAKRPATRREVVRHQDDHSQERFHSRPSL